MKNNIKEAMQALYQEITTSEQILILTHTAPDGDALGSVASLQLMLKQLGKQPDCLLEDGFPARFPHLKKYFTVQKETKKFYDLIIFVDCADRNRTGVLYPASKKTACIDHHISNPMDFDINIVDPASAATAELMYELLTEWKLSCNESIAAAIYTGILTDTGGFLFQNTTKKTHEIAAKLMDYPFDKDSIVRISFLEKSMTYSALYAHLLQTLTEFKALKSVIGYIDHDTYTKHHTTSDDTEGLSGALRNISGVECAVLLTEKEKGIIKGSIRTHDRYDANQLASTFGGGGHIRAAGFRTTLTFNEIKEQIHEWLSSSQ